MPFLFYKNKEFILIEERQRQGLLLQRYTKQGFSRPTLLFPGPFSEYSCTLGRQNTYYAVIKNPKNQVYLTTYNGTENTRSLVLEDTKKIYDFSQIHLGVFHDTLHLFYLAKTDGSTSLIHQKLGDSPSVDTLIPSLDNVSCMKIYSREDGIYLFYTQKKDHYTIECLKFSNTLSSFTLITTNTPIGDFTICFEENFLHILYVKALYGKQQIVYTNTRHYQPLNLALVQGDSKPSLIFCQQNLWVSYTDQEILHHMLSLDFGSTFTKSIQSSIKNNWVYYDFISSDSLLQSQALYASTQPSLRVLPLYHLDIYGLHPDLTPNPELELILTTRRAASTCPHHTSASPTTLQEPTPPAPQNTYSPTSQAHSSQNASPSFVDHPSNSSPSFSPQSGPQSVKDAARSFMQDFNRFDALPLDESPPESS